MFSSTARHRRGSSKIMRVAGISIAGLLIINNSVLAARARPHLDTSLGYRTLLTDNNTLHRGVSLSFDGGDPYGSIPANMPSQASLDSLSANYGLNTVHLYLEGDSSTNPNTPGHNLALADTIVQRTRDAGLYLIITIGNNGTNGSIHSMADSQAFWNLYGDRYKNETHVMYEAHNEPAFHTPNQWTTGDWNNQVTLYNTIRAAAPDTFTLLGSFMGFAGDPRWGANYLTSNGVDWNNAGFAHHGYESKAGIENAINLMQSNTSYPVLLNTEFFPGDTEGQGYNSMYESKHNGWMQFQWLGADDDDLLEFKAKINTAGTVWTPDDPNAMWPARGTPDIPATGTTVGIFNRASLNFLSAATGNANIKADVVSYTGTQNDAFTIEVIDTHHAALKAANGKYISTSGETDSLTANANSIGNNEIFEFHRLPNGDIALRAFGGGGHLIQRDPATGLLYPSADNSRDAEANFVIVTNPGTTPAPLVGNPFHGLPIIVPGVIQAEDFDLGGEGQGYHDSNAVNEGGWYRAVEGVGIEHTYDTGGGFNVGWIGNGEWMAYTIDVQTPGDYVLTARVATQINNAAFYVEFDGVNATGTLAVPNSGGWQTWTDVSTTITLDVGIQIMRFVRAGSPSAEFNLNYYELELITLPLAGDLNGDGFVGITDLNLVLGAWNANVTPGAAIDPSGDGFVGIADLNVVLGNWNAGTPPNDTANIPEPASLVCLALGALSLMRRSRPMA